MLTRRKVVSSIAVVAAFGLLLALQACTTPNAAVMPWRPIKAPNDPSGGGVATSDPQLTLMPPPLGPGDAYHTPTPDPVREEPEIRSEPVYHVVQYGDTLQKIAGMYGITVDAIMTVNNITSPNLLQAGTTIVVPAPDLQAPGPSFKILPDSELVDGPASHLFDLLASIMLSRGALLDYSEEVEGQIMNGAEIVDLVADRYSVNPRLLLALLEYQGRWLTKDVIQPAIRIYPMNYQVEGFEGLFNQLCWAADQLNLGYYLWHAGWEGPYLFSNGVAINPGAGVNAGTVGVQQLFSQLYLANEWRNVVSEEGFHHTFSKLFEDPFSRAIEPNLPEDLSQPHLQLPFEWNKIWAYTGGPHTAWGDGAAWGALDFAPPGFVSGCVLSNEWVVAVADGLIVRVEGGAVVQDLDGDGYEGTGWAILYMHIEERDRVVEGTYLQAGDRVGHPSCLGGFSTGTHVHIARKYNGHWIAADGPIPFILDGWVSGGSGSEYNGTLRRGNVILHACECRAPSNRISR